MLHKKVILQKTFCFFQTDDKGVFNTRLSKEFEILSYTFNIGKEQLKKLSVLSVQYSFADTEEKKCLSSIIENFE